MHLGLLAWVLVLAEPAGSRLPLRPGWVETGRLASEHATQAAAADGDAVFAVSDTHVAEYDRRTGRLVAAATAPDAKHMNSAFVWNGKVYCAHSNYPNKPDQSDIRVYDPAAKTLAMFHKFIDPPGSLVWNVHDGKHWWCCFAHYGKDNAKTVLVRMTGEFRETGRWTFPKAVVGDWDGMSASGGVWDGDTLLVSHHHYKVLYRLRVPRSAGELELVEELACPFPGQGIAADGAAGRLVGIDRAACAVVFGRRN